MSNTPTASSNAIQFSKYVNKSDLKGLPKIDVIKLITLRQFLKMIRTATSEGMLRFRRFSAIRASLRIRKSLII